jgi:hypothetical protein
MSEVMEKPVKAEKKPMKMYKITFNGDGGDVEIVHNFKLNVFKRNAETIIDENFLSVVKDAVVTTVVKGDDGVEKTIRIPQLSYTAEAI